MIMEPLVVASLGSFFALLGPLPGVVPPPLGCLCLFRAAATGACPLIALHRLSNSGSMSMGMGHHHQILLLQHLLTLILCLLPLEPQQDSFQLRVGRFGLNGLGCRRGRIPKCTNHSQTSAAVFPTPTLGRCLSTLVRAALSSVAPAVGKSAGPADPRP